MDIKENIRLEKYTTMGVGGLAEYFCKVKTKNELTEAAKWASRKNLPVFVLGDGSNLLISDKGIQGLVIKNEIKGVKVNVVADISEVRAGAGENWNDFVDFAVASGFIGVESLAGIPGTVGAAPVQNINAYGQSAGDVIKEVEVFDLRTRTFKFISKEECGFAYRTSVFKKETGPRRHIITSVVFSFRRGQEPVVAYQSLLKYFGEKKPTVKEIRDAVLKIRAQKGMVVFSDKKNIKSAGSFFINPVVDRERMESITAFAEEGNRVDPKCCAAPWFWEEKDLPRRGESKSGGKVKISAACLMHLTGFKPGTKAGKTGISPHHALALINRGGAKASDIKNFAEKIQEKVKDKFGIELQTEPEFVGF